MSDIFISYARSTATKAQEVAEALRALGYEVWNDDQIPAHRSFGAVIEERLDAARAVLVLWSADAARSEWVLSEANRARAAGKLVQAAIEPISLPMPFDTLECASLVGWDGDPQARGWKKIVASVDELTRRQPGRRDDLAPVTRRRAGGAKLAVAAVAAIGAAAVAALLIWGPLRAAPPPSLRSIALLPVRNLSGDPALDATAQALTEDTTELLGRSGEHRVPPLSRTVTMAKEPGLDDLAQGRRLHVRFVVTASLRKSSPGLRLSDQELDTVTGETVAANDLVSATPDLALAERRLALRLFYATGDPASARFDAYEMSRPANDRDPDNVDARLGMIPDTPRRQDVPAIERLVAAVRAVPQTSDLKAELEMKGCQADLALVDAGLASSPAQRRAWAEEALDLGARAAQLKPDASSPHECRVYTLIALERWDEAMAEARHIIETIPNSANGYEDLAAVEFARGQFRDALRDYIECAERHEQGDPFAIGLAQLFLGANGPALESFREFAVQSPKDPKAALFTAAALELAGRREEARSQAALFRSVNSDDSAWRILAQSHEPAFLAAADRVRKALRQVGLNTPDLS